MTEKDKKIIQKIKNNKVGVLATDTLYGLVGSAFSTKAVKNIYDLKKRNPKKPLIVLISEFDDIFDFEIRIDNNVKRFLKKVWPGKISVILTCKSKEFNYIHKGKKSIAFRMPDKKDLRQIIKKTGPIVAPSANLEGQLPAKKISEAKKYFGLKVDFYKNEGKLESKPSTVIKIKDNKIKVLRKGEASIENISNIKLDEKIL